MPLTSVNFWTHQFRKQNEKNIKQRDSKALSHLTGLENGKCIEMKK